mgnify:CR=1 FL=1
MGVDQRVGSLEKGKDADLVLFKDKPFVTIQDPLAVMMDGIFLDALIKKKQFMNLSYQL